MPVVFRHRGYRFFFYSNKGSPREAPHIQIEAGDGEAKLWLRPEVRVAYYDGFNGKTLRELLRVIEVNRERIESAWRNFFG
jgi:Domain of unknown function (DUF4160)